MLVGLTLLTQKPKFVKINYQMIPLFQDMELRKKGSLCNRLDIFCFLIPGSGSSSFSLSLGKAGRRDSGYFRNTLYMISTAFFLM